MTAKVSRFALSGIAIFALAFGLLTLYSGGQVIFGGAAARKAAATTCPLSCGSTSLPDLPTLPRP